MIARLLLTLGVVLMGGGLAHTLGVIYFYVTEGVPAADRVLIAAWVAQAQLLGGGLYLAAYRAWRTQAPWRALSVYGALTTIGLAAPMLPVLLGRAPLFFSVPLLVYLAASLFILARCAAAPAYKPQKMSEAGRDAIVGP